MKSAHARRFSCSCSRGDVRGDASSCVARFVSIVHSCALVELLLFTHTFLDVCVFSQSRMHFHLNFVRVTTTHDVTTDATMDGSQQNPEAVMHQVKAELANAYAQEFFSTVRDKCFAKCVTKPGRGMSSGESDCLGKCADRYVEATKMISQVVLRAYSEGGV